jgi:hypothetical protein
MPQPIVTLTFCLNEQHELHDDCRKLDHSRLNYQLGVCHVAVSYQAKASAGLERVNGRFK